MANHLGSRAEKYDTPPCWGTSGSSSRHFFPIQVQLHAKLPAFEIVNGMKILVELEKLRLRLTLMTQGMKTSWLNSCPRCQNVMGSIDLQVARTITQDQTSTALKTMHHSLVAVPAQHTGNSRPEQNQQCTTLLLAPAYRWATKFVRVFKVPYSVQSDSLLPKGIRDLSNFVLQVPLCTPCIKDPETRRT